MGVDIIGVDERGDGAPSSSEWLTVAVKSVNFPERVVSIIQRPTRDASAAMSPKFIFRSGVAGWSSSVLPVMVKPISSPCSFSVIFGWPESMATLCAGPVPCCGCEARGYRAPVAPLLR